jgi:hypothetical protein
MTTTEPTTQAPAWLRLDQLVPDEIPERARVLLAELDRLQPVLRDLGQRCDTLYTESERYEKQARRDVGAILGDEAMRGEGAPDPYYLVHHYTGADRIWTRCLEVADELAAWADGILAEPPAWVTERRQAKSESRAAAALARVDDERRSEEFWAEQHARTVRGEIEEAVAVLESHGVDVSGLRVEQPSTAA